jgi:two-component system phosphate regulon response regulator PhoB
MQVSKVLVIDGDRAARDTLVTCLNFVGVEAHGAESAAAARYWLTTGIADLLVVSDELADGAPVELLPRSATPASDPAAIIVLTRGVSRSSYPADDTLRRPIPVSRVVERIELLLSERRLRRAAALVFGALAFDLKNSTASSGGVAVEIGITESRLLAFFIGAPERVFSRAQLLQRIWPAGVRVEERTVDVHIRRLRLALERIGCAGYIQTVRGSGYRFSAFA